MTPITSLAEFSGFGLAGWMMYVFFYIFFLMCFFLLLPKYNKAMETDGNICLQFLGVIHAGLAIIGFALFCYAAIHLSTMLIHLYILANMLPVGSTNVLPVN